MVNGDKKTRIEVVNAVIVKEDKLLSIKRKDPPCKGMYTLPGGGIERSEQYFETAKRELKEELNLDVDCNENDYLGSVEIEADDLIGVVHFVRARVIGGKVRLLKGEVEEIRWISIDFFIDGHYKFGFKERAINEIRSIIKKVWN